MHTPAKDQIIVPLDVPAADDALRLVEQLAGVIHFFKIGLELYTRCGPSIVDQVRAAADQQGEASRVFLDLKLHDIPNTVSRAVRAAGNLGVDFLTVHLCGGSAMLQAAQEAAGGSVLLLGVTVLTSSDETTLAETGVTGPVEDQVMRLAGLAVKGGLGGVVASPLETGMLRARFGQQLKIVTPGVRPHGGTNKPDDQRRVLTPREAVAAGADHLVVGRPITGHADPRAAARQMVAEIVGAPLR